MADDDAYVPFSACDASFGTHSRAVRSQMTWPLFRSSAITTNRCRGCGCTPPCGVWEAVPVRPAGIAVSTNTLSPHTTGEADPRPGISVFQRTFFVSLHSIGGSAVRETPVAYGPRH